MIQIESARAQDRPAVAELLRASALPEGGLAEDLAGFFVARDEQGLAATCALEVHGPHGLLRSAAVRADRRGQGLGEALVARVVAEARARGLTDLYLLTTTAAAYFRRRGFVDAPRAGAPAPIRECWEFRTGCPSSSVLMRLPLGA